MGMYCHQASLYGFPIYDKANISIPDYFGYGSMTFNFLEIGGNAAQILALFSLKQLVSTIRFPHRATLIKINPEMDFDGPKEKEISIKSVRLWKVLAIGYYFCRLLAVIAMYESFISTKNTMSLVLYLVFLSFILIAICLMITGSMKLLYIANILTVLMLMIYCVGILIFQWLCPGIAADVMGCGLTAIYTLRVYHYSQDEIHENEDENSDISDSESNKIKTINSPKNNVDRQQSIESVRNHWNNIEVGIQLK